MLTIRGKKKFKCKQCGHVFEAIYTEGGFIAGPNLPHCPKCGNQETKFVSLLDKILSLI